MRQLLILCVLSLGGCLSEPYPALVAHPVKLEEVPPTVLASLRSNFPTDEVATVERVTFKGETNRFRFAFADGKHVEIFRDGKILQH